MARRSVTAVPKNPLLYDPSEVAVVLSIAEDTLRKIIRQECQDGLPDALRMVPGGRVNGNIVRIYAHIFDAVSRAMHLVREAAA